MICDNDLENEVVATLNLPLSDDCIWVADDNPEVRLLLERTFKRFFPPVPVEYFSDGGAIVKRIRRGDRAPRLLLLDFQMPSLNGIETLKRLNEEGATYETTVLMFSTCAGEKEVRDAYELGAQFFLQKPIGGEEYRELAKLCLRCLDLPISNIGSPNRWRALDVTAALVAVESVSENAEMSF